ncbi:hypothetical protein PG990_012014 [Apiospora arundinis]
MDLLQLNDERPPYPQSDTLLPDGGDDGDRQTVGVLDLPYDILYLIFDHFREDDWRACRASRLTCRRFCALATPLLFETLTIDLDVESVDRAETLVTQNPLIAASVRTVVVSLACRDPAQARDLPTFLNARWTELAGLLGCYGQWDTSIYAIDKERHGKEFGVLEDGDIYSEGPWEDPDRVTPEEFEAYRNWHRIKHALIDLEEEYTLSSTREHDAERNQSRLAPTEKGPLPWGTERETAVRTYRQLTMDAYKIYGQKCQEQLNLIESGSFARTVARCLVKMRHKALQVVMTHKPEFDLLSGIGTACHYINNNERLLWAMASPHYWCEVRDDLLYGHGSDRPERRPPAIRLLTEIPVACYHAGAPMSNLKLACFPASELPHGGSCLRSLFKFANRARLKLCGYVYVGDALRGKLESITVHMFPYDLGNVLATAATSWTHVHSLNLDGPCISQEDVETMCRNMAGGALMNYLMLSIRLLDGPGGRSSWANALDILRETLMGGRYSDVLASRGNFGLKGGELDAIYAEAEKCNPHRDEQPFQDDKMHREDDISWDPFFDDLEWLMEDNVMNLMQYYVSGDARVRENPLRADRGALCERITRPRKQLLLP